MIAHSIHSLSRRTPRPIHKGLSLIELLVCLVAVVAGIWAGAAYLDIDLQAACRLAMEKTGLTGPQEVSVGQDEANATLQPMSGTESTAGATAEASSHVKDPPANSEAADVGKARSAGEATLSYWNRLHEIIQQEQQTSHNGQQPFAGSPRQAVSAQGEAYKAAAQSIRQIPTRWVDAELVELAREIAQWYDRGAELATEGASVLDERELTSAEGPLARRWHTAQKQHAAERDLIGRKCTSLRAKLVSSYRLPFAELH